MRRNETNGTGTQLHVETLNSGLLDFLLPRSAGQQQGSLVHGCSLLSGPPQCGKTSLLLQLAYNLAIDSVARVVFICKPGNFDSDHIYLSQDADTSSEVFDRVHIKYIKDEEELCKYFAAFHMHVELPTAVIVDDFVAYFGGWDGHMEGGRAERERPMVKILCLCRSAIDYASERGGSGVQCRLVLSDTHLGDGPRLLYIFRRWLSQFYVIKAGNDRSTFTLEQQDRRDGEKGNVVGRYTLALQVLHFQGLERSSETAVDLDEHGSLM